MMPGVLAVVDLDIRDAARLLILFSANEFVADLPGGLLHHQFPSMANYTIFSLGILLLFLSFLFPLESVSQVAKKLVLVAAGHCRLSLDGASRAASLVGEIAYMILAQMQKRFKVLVSVVLAKKLFSAAAGLGRRLLGRRRKYAGPFPFVIIAALGIFANLIFPHHKFLSISIVAIFLIFLTMAVTLHSILILCVSVSVNVANKLV